MTKYEYHIVFLAENKIGNSFPNLTEILNEKGEEGWELCHVDPNPLNLPLCGIYIFKRVKKEGN